MVQKFLVRFRAIIGIVDRGHSKRHLLSTDRSNQTDLVVFYLHHGTFNMFKSYSKLKSMHDPCFNQPKIIPRRQGNVKLENIFLAIELHRFSYVTDFEIFE